MTSTANQSDATARTGTVTLTIRLSLEDRDALNELVRLDAKRVEAMGAQSSQGQFVRGLIRAAWAQRQKQTAPTPAPSPTAETTTAPTPAPSPTAETTTAPIQAGLASVLCPTDRTYRYEQQQKKTAPTPTAPAPSPTAPTAETVRRQIIKLTKQGVFGSEIARRCGLNPAIISRFKSGKAVNPTAETLRKIAPIVEHWTP